MDIWKCMSPGVVSRSMPTISSLSKVQPKATLEEKGANGFDLDSDVDVDLREVYFLIIHFLSSGPCQKTLGHLWSELMEHQLLPRRYHAWFSRSGASSGHSNDDGISFPLSYDKLVERNPLIEKNHLIKLLKQLILHTASPAHGKIGRVAPTAADVPTLLGTGSFSLLDCDTGKQIKSLPACLRWPHMQADQVRGLSLRQIGGGFTKHHRAPSIQSACYAIAKPSTMVQKMQNIKTLRGHLNAVYCAIFDRSGRYVITGSDDRLVKIWSMETALCLASCRGHEGDITDLAISSNNAVVASASNDFVIRVWRLPDGMPISVLRGHTGAVTAIAFSPRPSAVYQLLSSSDDGTCRIWDARYSNCAPQIYLPKPSDAMAGKNAGALSSGPSSSNNPQSHQILCCAYNANGTFFVTGSSDTYARVWNAYKCNSTESGQQIHEMDVLSGHENDVNYVQFSGCAVASRASISDTTKEENIPKFKNSWFCHDNIVTCSRDGSAIIWVPKSRRSHGKTGRWIRAYHLKVPPPPLPPQPPRGGPRQRLLPTPRGVNMVVWSLDNRFVLAAIMDCRICVWNAVDGSLVHSLTGHTASSYVLDVHPFNPRIAMSAGYDGRTIVWDIWEGTPIRIYEIGRFKLVDGKFSPDGTSIVLSDDVGQIYLLNTGQGESQKDAKYDQFFLGDYRPLVRDTNGHILDQETQLPPHRRNAQDLLCDSSMIPYPEPYQSMYQRRRLGALGMEWRPSSIKFATGPDFSLGQDYQIPPLEDLERMIEPLPEFMNPIWDPDIEFLSDDSDSEYNVFEDYSSEAEKRSLNGCTSSDPECSAEDSEVERRHKDGICKSRKKKQKIEVESMTSSGRRIKKRNLDDRDGSIPGMRKAKKSRSGRKISKKRLSKAKALRTQRAAARNALNMFSQISGTSTDEEDEDDSEDSSSDDELMLQDSNTQSNICDRNVRSPQQKNVNEQWSSSKAINEEHPAAPNIEHRKRLIVKFPIRDSNQWSGSVMPTDVSSGLDPSFDPHKEQRSHVTGDEEHLGTHDVHRYLSTGSSPLHDHQPGPSFLEDKEMRSIKLSGSDNGGVRDLEDLDDANSKNETHKLEEDPPRKLLKLKIKMRPPASSAEGHTSAISEQGKAATRSSSLQLMDSASSIKISRAVPEREESLQARTELEDFDGAMQGNNLHSGRYQINLSEPTAEVVRRSRSTRMKTTQGLNAVNHTFEVRRGSESTGRLGRADNLRPCGEEKMPRGSGRNRQDRFSEIDQMPSAGGKANDSVRKISWLTLVENEESYRYIPQLGDEVAYLRQGHQEFIETTRLRDAGPWRYSKGIRAVEMCKVEGLDYATLPGSGDSCCKITLKFVDPAATAFGKTFKLTLPELSDFSDFVVEKSRYIAAMDRKWTIGDKCQVWWRYETVQGGDWWEGQIVSSQAKSEEFPDSPWEKYSVCYDNDNDEPKRHSPWELHDPDTQWEHPYMDTESRDRLLSSFYKLENPRNNKDYYGMEKLNQVAEKMDFCNRFPVPLSPIVIRLRLENNYYRSLEAVKHDITVMLSNAKSYFDKKAEVLTKVRRLSDYFEKILSKL